VTIPYSADLTCVHGEAHPCPHGCPETEAARAERLLSTVRDGAWLDAQDFPPLRYAVPGVVPEGFTLLVGPPKAGKSWLALAILLAVAMGGRALARIDVPKGRVLYLALEDGDRRMQDRCRTLLGSRYRPDDPIPGAFHYVTRVGVGEVLTLIEAFLERYPDTVLIVIDTLGKVMPPALPNETPYGRDYRVGGRLKAIADARPGLAVVALHHDRKAAAEDFVDRVSGTNGLAGAADTVIVLSRARQSDDGTLAVTGRDIPEGEYAISMVGGSWVLDGANLAEAAQTARERTATESLGELSMSVLAVVNRHPGGVRPREIAAELGIDPKTAGTYLGRLFDAKRIGKSSRGVYTPVGSVESVEDEYADSTETTDPTAPVDEAPLWDEP
jgi:hypothetical protein